MHAEVFQGQPGWQGMIDQCPGGFGHQHLPTMAGARDAGGPMDVQAKVLIANERRFAGVQTDPDPHLPVVRPGVLCQHLLDGGGAGARFQCALEDDEERIALGAELVATVGGERLALDRVVGEQDVGVALAELLNQPGRPLDVAEEERDGPGRQCAHAGEAAPLNTGSSALRSSSWYSRPLKSSSGSGASGCSVTAPSLRT